MSSLSPRSRVRTGVLALGVVVLATSTVALGLPWDIDMSDGQQVKAYEQDMGTLPEGVVSQPQFNAAMTARSTYAPNYPRASEAAEALVNPLDGGADTVATGKQMFTTYCAPCHGDGVNLGAVAGAPPNRMPGVSVLAGPNGVARTRSDGYIYTTIRNGGNVMPSYGWAMNDREIWSTVAYVRTMDNAAYAPPAPSASGATP
jgi:mono/diheme cytochrome c family protein